MLLDKFAERFQRFRYLGERVLVALFVGHLRQHGGVFYVAVQVGPPVDAGAQGRQAPLDLLRGLGVAPEVGLTGLLVQLGDLRLFAIDVKDDLAVLAYAQ